MTPTPELPRFIREFRMPDRFDGVGRLLPPAYRNVFEPDLFPDEKRLFCTETLYGDWDAPVLLLAKDAAPLHVFTDRRAAGDPDPWRHGQAELDGPKAIGVSTNRILRELADEHLPGPKLYGSAIAHLLKTNARASSELVDFRDRTGPLRTHVERVLRWVTDNMTDARAIACLGNDAWDLVTSVYAPRARGLGGYELGKPLDGEGGIVLFRLYHTRSWFAGGRVARKAEWARMAAALRERGVPLGGVARPPRLP